MLAAGTGSRLSNNDETQSPKSLLQFEGKSLLERHIEILRSFDIENLTLVVGYRADEIIAEIKSLGAEDFVEIVMNEDYLQSSMVSLWCAREPLTSGADILFMDADVLYHPDMIGRLASHHQSDCILMDRNFEHGDEPVKLCIKDGKIVEFRKIIDVDCDHLGEWPGFMVWSSTSATKLAGILSRYMYHSVKDAPYEEAFREILLESDENTIQIEDITGMPWIEIDFPEDLLRAENEILTAINNYSPG